MEKKENFQICLDKDNHYAEIVVREGVAGKIIEPKPPVRTDILGVINTPVEYLKKRVNTGQFTQELSHILVDRDRIQIVLVINENDEYLRGTVTGTLNFNPKFFEFGINTGKLWKPYELGYFFKMNRAFFPDRQSNMKLVSDLSTFTATVNSSIERTVKETGDRADSFIQAVNSNLPPRFMLKIPIFKGFPAENLEVETYANVDGRDISLTLISPGANQIKEDIRDNVINAQLNEIVQIAPNIAIIEI